MTFHIFKNNQQSGPITLEEIRHKLNSGELTHNDMAWYEGAAQWAPISTIPGIVAPHPTQSSPISSPPLPSQLGLIETKPSNLIAKITNPTPLWACWGINGLAWTVFIMTGSHFLEFVMGLACVYSGLVAFYKVQEKGAKQLIFASFGDAIWMFYWAFARPMDDSSGVLDIIRRLF
jgi:hypothetical protein